MRIRQFYLYIANLDPRFGTEPGKTRPVIVIQTDMLNNHHPSTLICPVSSQVNPKAELLRVHLAGKGTGLTKPSDILVDQIRVIDNRRFVKEIGKVPIGDRETLVNNLKTVLFE